MRRRFVPLDRPALLEQLLGFMAAAHRSTVAPDQATPLPIRLGKIPPALRRPPSNHAEAQSIRLSGAEAEAFNEVRHHLGNLRETEWLATEKLDEELWTLACDMALAPANFETDAQRLLRAETILEQVLRPLRAYEVALTVDHLDPPAEPISVWDVRLAVGTVALMEPFVRRAREDFQAVLTRPFLGKAVLLLQVDGTAAISVIERARDAAHHRLHVLRTGLAGHWQTHPDQLRFELGGNAIARALSGPPDEWHQETRQTTPIALHIHSGHNERLQELRHLHDALAVSHSSLRAPVERACEWIGRGLCRLWPGDALRDYTTAIEALLITAEREKKSVLVPYRMLALADLHGRSMIHPAAVRQAYDRRSTVVHEGKGEVADEHATRTMLGATRDCIGWLVRFAASHPDNDHAALLRALDTPALRTKAVAWLAQFRDPWSSRLAEGIRSLP